MVAQTCQGQTHSNFDEKTKDYRRLKLDRIILVISNPLLFSHQEINWPLITKLVSNGKFMEKKSQCFLIVFLSTNTTLIFMEESEQCFLLMEECKYSLVTKTTLSRSLVKRS